MPKLNLATALDRGLELWLFKTARKNFWRVASYYEIEDLIADGYMVYAECRERYKDRVTERRHFAALFRTCFINHITDLANKRSRELNATVTEGEAPRDAVRVEIPAQPASDKTEEFEDLIPPVLPEAEVAVLLQQAQGPVQLVLKLMYTDAGLNLLRENPQRPRESTNSYYCRVLGYDANEYNLIELFRSFIAGCGPYYMRRRSAI